MSPESYQEIQQAFLELRKLKISIREKRLRQLRESTPEIADAVCRLLAADSDGLKIFDEPLIQRNAADDLETSDIQHLRVESAEVPKRIGPYRILQKIGEGGHGVVFMAEQSAPIRRKVAIKWLKPGLDSKMILARFEAERQALAMMNHPSIANVLDADSTESGQPYFVMELVHGVPIDEFCNRNQLSLEERLRLFQQVCRAVHHAHRKGIIHRDIKPGNVLVTVDEGKPLAKVIDFGIAKAVHMPLTEKTMYTEYGQIIGTLEYMSPEQSLMSQSGIDIRSDVYSLGVLLYLLITGETPLNKNQLLKKGIWELTNVLQNSQPATPSTRITQQKNPASWREQNRAVQSWVNRVKGDLDWITMKALAKEPEQRYDTAAEFAEDIESFIADEAVVARPPTKWYRLTKFVKRNRVAALISTSMIGAMLIAIGGLTWGYFQAQERLVAVTKAKEEVNQKAIALENEKTRADASSRKLAKMLERSILESAWMTSLDGDFETATSTLSDVAKPDRNFEWRFVESVGKQMQLPILRRADASAIRVVTEHSKNGLLGVITTDSILEVWDVATMKQTESIQLPNAIYTCMAFNEIGGMVLAGTAGGSLVLTDVLKHKIVSETDLYKGGIRGVTFGAADSQWLVTSGANYVCSVENSSLVEIAAKKLSERISSLAVSADGKYLVVASLTGKLFGLTDGMTEVQMLPGINEPVAAFRWIDHQLVGCGWSGKVFHIKIANSKVQAATQQTRETFQAKQVGKFPERITAIYVKENGDVLAAGKNGDVHAWIKNSKKVVWLRNFSTPIRAMRHIANSDQLVVYSSSEQVSLISLSELNDRQSAMSALQTLQDGVALSNGGVALSAHRDGSVRRWKLPTAELLNENRLHDSEIFEIAINEQAGLYATVGTDQQIVIASVEDLTQVHKLKCNWGVRCLVFSADGKILAGAPDPENQVDLREGSVDLWDVQTGKSYLRLAGHQNWVTHIRFVANDTKIVTLSVDGTAKVWLAATGELLHTVELSFLPFARSMAIGRDGNLFTGHDDGSIHKWDMKTGKQIQSASISEDSVFSLASCLNAGRLIAASRFSSNLVFLNTETLNVNSKFDAGVGNLQGLRLDKGSKQLQVFGESGMRVWSVPNPNLPDH